MSSRTSQRISRIKTRFRRIIKKVSSKNFKTFPQCGSLNKIPAKDRKISKELPKIDFPKNSFQMSLNSAFSSVLPVRLKFPHF